MNPLDVINNANTMIQQMGITIKDAFTRDEDATQNGLNKWYDSALSIYHNPPEELLLSTNQKN